MLLCWAAHRTYRRRQWRQHWIAAYGASPLWGWWHTTKYGMRHLHRIDGQHLRHRSERWPLVYRHRRGCV